MKENDILFESAAGWISTSTAAGFSWKGFCVWRHNSTHSELLGRVGYGGAKGFAKAKEILSRITNERKNYVA